MLFTLKQASISLINGAVVAVPTETVYGLAATLYQPKAIDQIFKLKGRPANNPLIIHLADPNQLSFFVENISEECKKLMDVFWPGPMTLVLPVDTKKIPHTVRAGLQTAAFRIPSHLQALELLSHTGPLVMPSANISGRPSSTLVEHIERDFGKQFPVLDGEVTSFGVESTILYQAETEWEVIRLGALPPEAFRQCLGYCPKVTIPAMSKPLCPGQMHRHYAPNAKLILGQDFKKLSGVVIGFTDRSYESSVKLIPLGPLSQPELVASNVYRVLRQLDVDGIDTAMVDMCFPHEGLWLTISERLQRAAAG